MAGVGLVWIGALMVMKSRGGQPRGGEIFRVGFLGGI